MKEESKHRPRRRLFFFSVFSTSSLFIACSSFYLSLFHYIPKHKQGAAEQANAPSSEEPRGPGTGFDAHGEVATHLGTTAKDELDNLGYDPVTGAVAVAVEGNPGETLGELGGYKDPIQGNNPLPDQQERLRLAVEEEKKKKEEEEKKK